MTNFAKFLLISTVLAGINGCSAQQPSEPKAVSTVNVMPAGTVLKVALIDAIGTDRSSPGDHFSASLAEAVMIDGKTFLEKGTRIRGRVFDLREPHLRNSGAELHLVLTEIIYGDKTIVITTHQFEAKAARSDATRGEDIHYAVRARIDFILATQVEI